MLRLVIEFTLILVAGGFGWFAKGKWGTKVEAIKQAVDQAAK